MVLFLIANIWAALEKCFATAGDRGELLVRPANQGLGVAIPAKLATSRSANAVVLTLPVILKGSLFRVLTEIYLAN